MINPFVHSGKAVASVWNGAGNLDFWTPGMARTMAIPIYPLAAAGGFIAAFFQKKDSTDSQGK